MREDSAGSPARARVCNEGPAAAGSKLLTGSGSRGRRSENSWETKGRTIGAGCGSTACSKGGGTTETGAGAAAAGTATRGPLWRPLPPLRPRRLRRWAGRGPATGVGADASVGCSKTESCWTPSGSPGASGACASDNSVMTGSNRVAGSVPGSLTEPAAGATGIGAPRRVRASSAFCFHCARRKRSAAAVYQRAASECAPVFS